jgi:hypothetical protein
LNVSGSLNANGTIRATSGLFITNGGINTINNTSTLNAITALDGTAGYVGIGTTSPGVALDVNGSINTNFGYSLSYITIPTLTKNHIGYTVYGKSTAPQITQSFNVIITCGAPISKGIWLIIMNVGTINITNGSPHYVEYQAYGDIPSSTRLTIANSNDNVNSYYCQSTYQSHTGSFIYYNTYGDFVPYTKAQFLGGFVNVWACTMTCTRIA